MTSSSSTRDCPMRSVPGGSSRSGGASLWKVMFMRGSRPRGYFAGVGHVLLDCTPCLSPGLKRRCSLPMALSGAALVCRLGGILVGAANCRLGPGASAPAALPVRLVAAGLRVDGLRFHDPDDDFVSDADFRD